jgi:hypothetical protein
MTEVLANITQVITNSPQVNTLVAGEMAAVETAKRQAQIMESRKYEEVLSKTVLAMENSGKINESDPDGRQRRELRRERRRATAKVKTEKTGAAGTATGRAETPFEAKSVIDICI